MNTVWQLLGTVGLSILAKYLSYQDMKDENVKRFYQFVEGLAETNKTASRLHQSYQDQLLRLGEKESNS